MYRCYVVKADPSEVGLRRSGLCVAAAVRGVFRTHLRQDEFAIQVLDYLLSCSSLYDKQVRYLCVCRLMQSLTSQAFWDAFSHNPLFLRSLDTYIMSLCNRVELWILFQRRHTNVLLWWEREVVRRFVFIVLCCVVLLPVGFHLLLCSDRHTPPPLDRQHESSV